jgi:outer membrane receptor protein involved in Fe transport
MLKRLSILLLAISASFFGFAQTTTSSITGTVKDNVGQPLASATVTATHVPSGTNYSTLSSKDGVFSLQGLRVGGPYQVKIDFVGLKSAIFENITLQLGEAYNVNAQLSISEQVMENVIVASRTRRAAPEKQGMTSVINNRLLTTLPTISRSITDFTRATPQANGNNFGGRDARYNNITIDGANLNNNFGLSTDPLPGGGNNPISLDAIEEVSVSLAPYDVRQGNFTGGNIAAITKSGTNSIHGTAYAYWQNQNLRGSDIAGQKASNPKFVSKVFGGSIGGPIIKNKVFYFINGEYETKPPSAGITWSPKGGSGEGNVSDVPVDSLKAVQNYLNTTFKYDPGVYDNFPAFKNENHKILGKIDWNISTKHKLTVKYSDFKGTQDFQPSASGNIGGNYSGATYGSKFSSSAMSFSSVLYQQEDIVRSGSLELNSNFSKKMSNQFLATFTKIQSDKTHAGANFPFIDILWNAPNDKRNEISVGNEPFNGNNNKVHNDVLTITDNFSYYVGKQTLTGGLSYEYQKVGNMFMRGSQGYYVFANVSDFVNNRVPLKYAQTYSLIPGQDAIFSAQLKIGQLSAYAQDEINVSPALKFTVGIRMDQPMYPEQPIENPANTALTFQDQNGNPVHYNNGKWPKATALFSPRGGFRWDVNGDKRLIIRGGTGLFTGRIPYVYLTNIPTNSGMYQFSAAVDNTRTGVTMSDFLFNPEPQAYNPFYNSAVNTKYPTFFPIKAGTSPSGDFVVTDPNYKFPQVWKTDFAFDQQIGKTWKVTVEAMYTKDINATYMFDANQKKPDATVTTGSYTRGYYSNNAARKLNSAITGNAIVLANSSRGSSFVFTTQLEKAFAKGLSGSIAYTYTYAANITENPGSQASSVYQFNTTGNTLNDLELAYAQFAVPHRVVGYVSYRYEYIQHLATTVSLIYEGAANGTYSYIYNGSVNNQGYNSANLIYIPKNALDPTEIKFKDATYTSAGVVTAAQQAQIFEDYINQDPYLSKHRGQIAERNGPKRPWYNRLDMKVLQDIFTNVGPRRHTIQISADIYNLANLINHDWGARKIYTINNPLKVESVTGGVPTFSITSYNGAPVNKTFINTISTSSTWSMQLGVRYIF